MKFSVATIAVMATAAAAQNYGYQQQQGYQDPAQYQGYQGQQGQQPQQYQYPPYGVAGPAPTQNKYGPAEAAAWHSCVDGLLDQINNGHEGTKMACSTWKCLENNAAKYNRGGALAAAGGLLSGFCGLSGVLPVRYIRTHSALSFY
ncbi:hypothetical protein PoHVEF18_007663 [Penicillium ochrochloron]